MIIIIGKYGQKIEFTNDYSELNVAGGKIEIMGIIKLLALHNPNDTFWVISRSNVHEMPKYEYDKLFPNGNVFCVFDKRLLKKHNVKNAVCMESIDIVEKVLEGESIRPDAAVLFPGIGLTSVVLPGMPRVDGTGDVLLSDTALYGCTPKIVYLNKHHKDMKIIDLCTDPNYTTWKQAKDLHYHVDHFFAQHSYEGVRKEYTENRTTREFKEYTIQIEYLPLHESYMFQNECLPIDINNKTKLFSVILNEGQMSRYPMLNEWVLSNKLFKDIEIYGKWKSLAALQDDRFKGAISYGEVESVLSKTRCTFIIPIEPGWVTVKYLEMLRNGVIPLFHPSYDSNHRLNTPDWMRPKDQAELIKTVLSFNDDSIYLARLEEARSMLYTDTTGKDLNTLIMSSLVDGYTIPAKKPNKAKKDIFSFM